MKNKILIIYTLYFVISIFLINLVFGLSAEVNIIKNSIFMDEYATYKIKLTNPTNNEKNIRIYSTDIAFYSESEPSIITLEPNSEKEILLKLSPNSWSTYGAKSVEIIALTNDNQKVEFSVPIYIKTYDMIEKKYSPSVELKIDFSNEVDPRKEYPLTIYLRNRNKLNIESMDVYVRSKNFNYDLTGIKLEPYPNGEYKETITYSIDKYTPSTIDQIEVTLLYENKSFNRLKYSFKIINYSDFIVREEKTDELFKKITEYNIKNEGNSKKADTFRYPTSFLKRFFTSTNIKFDNIKLKKEGYFEWNLELEPLEEVNIRIVENYRPIIYFFLTLLFSILIYYLYRSPVVAKKEAIVTGKTTEGISNMKVLLYVRNRSQDLIEKIEIKEIIPSIAEYIQEERHGTLEPTKIVRNDKKGTILKWELEALEPFEERLITYRIKSKILVVGGLTLPSAKIKFHANSKERAIKSNKCDVTLSI